MAYKDPHDPRLLEKRRAHYRANKESYKERSRAQRAELVALLRKLRSGPCTDCGGSFPHYVMEFDHRPDEEWLGHVRQMLSYGRRKLLAEIAKCDLVCANCHRIRTWERGQQNGLKPV